MSAEAKYFVDTNVILYALSANEPVRQVQAERWLAFLWSNGGASLSWQVIHEFYAKAVTKLGVGKPLARRVSQQFIEWVPVVPSQTTLLRAWHWCDAAGINFWDALIVASAEQSGCRHLLTEDLQDGQRFGSVTVVNPFTQPPQDV